MTYASRGNALCKHQINVCMRIHDHVIILHTHYMKVIAGISIWRYGTTVGGVWIWWTGTMDGTVEWWNGIEWNVENNQVLRHMHTWYHLSSYDNIIIQIFGLWYSITVGWVLIT